MMGVWMNITASHRNATTLTNPNTGAPDGPRFGPLDEFLFIKM